MLSPMSLLALSYQSFQPLPRLSGLARPCIGRVGVPHFAWLWGAGPAFRPVEPAGPWRWVGPPSATLAVLRSPRPLALAACRCSAAALALCSLGDTGSSFPVSGMSHEPKSPSIGMLSTATRTTATVNPLTPSPLNGALVPTGSPATSSALSAQAAPSSSFAAALRKLAKQAEEPRGKRHQATSSWDVPSPPCTSLAGVATGDSCPQPVVHLCPSPYHSQAELARVQLSSSHLRP